MGVLFKNKSNDLSMSKLSGPQRNNKKLTNKMSKIANSIIDVPINDTDYDFVKKESRDDYEEFLREQHLSDAEDMMVGVKEEERVEGDTLSFSPEE